MDAQTKRDFAGVIENIAAKLSNSVGPLSAKAFRDVAHDLRNAAEEPSACTPKFKPGDRVRFIKDKGRGGVVLETCCDGSADEGRVCIDKDAPPFWSGADPHESELELGEPIPERPIPLGLGDICRLKDVLDADEVPIIHLNDNAVYLRGVRWCLFCEVERVGPPVEIAPGRAVHVLDKDGKVVADALFEGTIARADCRPVYKVWIIKSGPPEWHMYHRHELRLAAYLQKEA